MICNICGAEPCVNPSFCRTCREAEGIDGYGYAGDAHEQAGRSDARKFESAERKHNGPGEANPGAAEQPPAPFKTAKTYRPTMQIIKP
jgi:hypothetical protein